MSKSIAFLKALAADLASFPVSVAVGLGIVILLTASQCHV